MEWKYQKPSGWSTQPHQCATACSFSDAKKDKFEILLSKPVELVIKSLCSKIKVEWQMLLIGEGDHEGLIITDYYIPKQKVTGSTVKNLDCIDAAFVRDRKVVATIHSHSNMGVFFSPTDDEYTNNSIIKTHLVVNNKFEFVACNRVDLPCGMVKFNEAQVMIEGTVDVPVIGEENITIDQPEYGFSTYDHSKWDKESMAHERDYAWNQEEYEMYKDDGYPAMTDMYGHPLYNADREQKPFMDLSFGKKNKKNKKYKMLKGGLE